MIDAVDLAITFVQISETTEEVKRISGFWPVPIGSTIELGEPNRDYRVDAVRMRVNGDEKNPRIDLFLDCVAIS